MHVFLIKNCASNIFHPNNDSKLKSCIQRVVANYNKLDDFLSLVIELRVCYRRQIRDQFNFKPGLGEASTAGRRNVTKGNLKADKRTSTENLDLYFKHKNTTPTTSSTSTTTTTTTTIPTSTSTSTQISHTGK